MADVHVLDLLEIDEGEATALSAVLPGKERLGESTHLVRMKGWQEGGTLLLSLCVQNLQQ